MRFQLEKRRHMARRRLWDDGFLRMMGALPSTHHIGLKFAGLRKMRAKRAGCHSSIEKAGAADWRRHRQDSLATHHM
jgi:hypothetical protein